MVRPVDWRISVILAKNWWCRRCEFLLVVFHIHRDHHDCMYLLIFILRNSQHFWCAEFVFSVLVIYMPHLYLFSRSYCSNLYALVLKFCVHLFWEENTLFTFGVPQKRKWVAWGVLFTVWVLTCIHAWSSVGAKIILCCGRHWTDMQLFLYHCHIPHQITCLSLVKNVLFFLIVTVNQYKQLLKTVQGLTNVSHSITTGTVPGAWDAKMSLFKFYFIDNEGDFRRLQHIILYSVLNLYSIFFQLSERMYSSCLR